MFPNANAPEPTQPWVRNVTDRADSVRRKASSVETNSFALADSNKAALALISERIANINTFTTGLFQQEQQVDNHNTFASIANLPVLYEYMDGDFRVAVGITKRIPFAKYKELTVTVDGIINAWTTDATATGIGISSGLLPIIQATIPAMTRRNANGSITPNEFSYASRWTVENFEPFAGYNIPSNLVPIAPSSTFDPPQAGQFHPEFSASTGVRYFRDNYTGYSMRYTREWLSEYMEAIRSYAMTNSPPPAGAYFYPPDIDEVEIILGYAYKEYLGPATNTLYVNDSRLSFKASNTFILEGIRNLGY